jgi:hypothetical protein
MCCESGLRLPDLPRDDQIGEFAVGANNLVASLERAHEHSTIAICLIVKIGMGGQHPWRSAGADQRCVEPLMQGVKLRASIAQSLGILLRVAPQVVKRPDDGAFPRAVATQNALSKRLAFNQRAQLGDVLEIRMRNCAHAETALTDRDDQTARDEA